MRIQMLQALGAAALLALVTACATPLEATTDFDRSFDFNGVQKIAFTPVNRMDASAIRISDMQISRVNEALADELRRKGMQVVDNASDADMLLTWHLVTQERTDVRTYNSMSTYNCWRCGPSVSDVSVRQYTQGTLIVDLIDPMRNQSAWRAIIESRLSSKPSPEDAAEKRTEAARAIFAEFPPR
ncbi:MAG: DUF4136 domain-containing protein [Halieaceae bacterium]